ncbi:MAG: hypothetical protein CMJ83_13310 [Planctomycetes bacterium]|nr:hypothetical protein [Planctomycetota bacterium]
MASAPRTSSVLRRQHGFTLVEILLTLAVIAMTMGFVAVSIGGLTPGERIRAAARNLAGMSDFIRSQTAGAKVKCYFDIDFDHQRYRWRMEPPTDEVGRFIDPDTKHLLTVDEVQQWRESMEWEDLPRGVYFKRLYHDPKHWLEEDWQWVEYRPDGTITSYMLWIGAKSGDLELKFSISVNGLTGKSEVFKGWRALKQADESDFNSVMGDGLPGANR